MQVSPPRSPPHALTPPCTLQNAPSCKLSRLIANPCRRAPGLGKRVLLSPFDGEERGGHVSEPTKGAEGARSLKLPGANAGGGRGWGERAGLAGGPLTHPEREEVGAAIWRAALVCRLSNTEGADVGGRLAEQGGGASAPGRRQICRALLSPSPWPPLDVPFPIQLH